MDPHSPPPYTFLPAQEDVDPYVEKVFDELWLMTLPDSEFAPIHDIIVPFIDALRNGIDNSCCPPHKTSNMGTIRSECYIASQCRCTKNALLHKFYSDLVDIFDKHMSKCMVNIVTKKMLYERTN